MRHLFQHNVVAWGLCGGTAIKQTPISHRGLLDASLREKHPAKSLPMTHAIVCGILVSANRVIEEKTDPADTNE
jgi:hypothetical protein